jgi:hypothetical protein
MTISIVKQPYEFACDWYRVEDIHRAILSRFDDSLGNHDPVPSDVRSLDFAEWLTRQYRLAMTRGAVLATAELEAMK